MTPCRSSHDAASGEERDLLVTPLHGDIRTFELPEAGYDAIVSLDAWEYFGTDVHFLPRLVRALRPGGVLGFVTPSLREDPYLSDPLPVLADVFDHGGVGALAP